MMSPEFGCEASHTWSKSLGMQSCSHKNQDFVQYLQAGALFPVHTVGGITSHHITRNDDLDP